MCAKALLGDPLPPIHPGKPKDSAVDTVRKVVKEHRRFWKCLTVMDCILPESISSFNQTTEDSVGRLEQDLSEMSVGPARSVQRSKLVSQ